MPARDVVPRMRRLLIFLPLIWASNPCVERHHEASVFEVPLELRALVAEIASGGALMSGAVGYAGTRPEQYERFVLLSTQASTEALVALTEHPHPVVRSYAFWGVAERGETDLWPLVISHLDDDQIVPTCFGCLIGEKRVGDFFVEVATQDQFLEKAPFDAERRALLSEVLVATPNNLDSRSTAILAVGAKPAVYPALKALVGDERYGLDALIAVARFQRAEDATLILEHLLDPAASEDQLSRIYRAAQAFPHPALRARLVELLAEPYDDEHFHSVKRELFAAVAAYRDETSAQLLWAELRRIEELALKRYYAEFLFSALDQESSPVFDELILELWRTHGTMNVPTLERLARAHEERVVAQASADLADVRAFYERCTEHAPEVARAEMDLLFKVTPDLAHERMQNALRTANITMLESLITLVNETRDERTVSVLLDRLRWEENGWVCSLVIRTLHAFGKAELDAEIERVRSEATGHCRPRSPGGENETGPKE